MAMVLKIATQGGVHRLRLEEAPTFNSLDALLKELYPKAGAQGGCRLARYTDEDGDACLLTKATFADFLETARTAGGGVCPVLRLEVVPPPLRMTPRERAGHDASRVAEEAPHRLSRSTDRSRAASPAASWICLDAARDRGSSDCSWVCAGGSPDGGSSRRSTSSSPRPKPEGSRGERRSCSESNERILDESFEPLAFNLAELHANDWDSNASGRSEPELAGGAMPLLNIVPGSMRVNSKAAASTKEAQWGEEDEDSEEVVLSFLHAHVAAVDSAPTCNPSEAELVTDSALPNAAAKAAFEVSSSPAAAVLSTPAKIPRLIPSQDPAPAPSQVLTPEPAPVPVQASEPMPTPAPIVVEADAVAVEAGEEAECHFKGLDLDLEAGLGSTALLPCGGHTPSQSLGMEPPATIAPPPSPIAVAHCRPPAAAGRGWRATPAAGMVGEGVPESHGCSSLRAAMLGGKPAQLGAGMEKVVHLGHICDGCEACPLPGPRFTCRTCCDYDLCWTCYMQKDQLPQPHDPSHRFQQVLWSEEVVPVCPGGCGFGVTANSGHPTHCCMHCADVPSHHTAACLARNAHDDELDP